MGSRTRPAPQRPATAERPRAAVRGAPSAAVRTERSRRLTAVPVQVEQVAALAGTAEIRRYAALAEAADRLRIAQAVLAELTSFTDHPDLSVVALACEELRLAEQRYLRLTRPAAVR